MKKISPEFKYACMKTLPIMISYFFIATAYGLIMQQGGFNWLWSGMISIFLYTGAFQFVLAAFLASGASVLTVLLTCAFMSSRQIFYGLSFLDDFRKTGKKLPYMIHSLTDETYALYTSIPEYPADLDQTKVQFWIGVTSQASWVLGSVLGGLLGNLIPSSVQGVDFALTALFITIVVDQWRNMENHVPAATGMIVSLVFLLWLGADRFLLPALIVTSGILIYASGGTKEAEA